jgi:competence protein ComEC
MAASKNLEIYWIDAEGGGCTLIVAPSGESLLIDTANRTPDDRDAKRILAAAQLAGLKKIDVLVTTHYHGDHNGAMAALAKLIPIGTYMDHGPSVELDRPPLVAAFKAYEDQIAGKHRILKAGDKVPLKGVDVQVVMSNGEAITSPQKGAGKANPACADFKERPADPAPENNQSVALLLKFGKFNFIDLGDLTWNYEQKLVCPKNLIGKVDVFQVMNNGPRKGGLPSVFETLRKSPGLEDIWQVHLALNTTKAINTDERMIANLEPTEECKGALMKASVASDGKYTLTNLRNNYSKTYQAH